MRRTDFSKRFHRREIALRLNGRKRSVAPRVRMIRVRAMRDQVIEQAKASEKRGESKCGFARVVGCVNVAVRLQERPCYVELAFVNDTHQSRIAITVSCARIRAGDHQLMTSSFVGEAVSKPSGDPEDLFKVDELVKGVDAALPVADTGCYLSWPV